MRDARSSPSPGVTLRWEPRELIADTLDWDDDAGDYRKIRLPFPIVGISAEAFQTLQKETGLELDGVLRTALERLVARRIFGVCGHTDFGVDKRETILPAIARPDAASVAELLQGALGAMDRVDEKAGGTGRNCFDREITAAMGADPRAVIKALAECYSRNVPTAPESRDIRNAVFMAEVRDQIVMPALENSSRKVTNLLLAKFLAGVDDVILRPLERIGPGDKQNRVRRRRNKPLKYALANSTGAMEKAIQRFLRPNDERLAAIGDRWQRAAEILTNHQRRDGDADGGNLDL